jgi:lysophospholipase L1-like esterase
VSFFRELFMGGEAKSQLLSTVYSKLAFKPRVQLLKAENHCEVSNIDGIHLDATAHRHLGHGIAKAIQKALPIS